MKDSTKAVLKQLVPILASALAAAGFAFAQSVAAHAGLCPTSPLSIATTGALGGIIKAGHTLVQGLINSDLS